MLVATFSPSTAWVGKTITWDGDRFVLEGYGPVPAAALVDYDQHGHLQWPSAELRSWAWAYAHWEASGAPAGQAAQPQMAAQPYATAQPYAAAQAAPVGQTYAPAPTAVPGLPYAAAQPATAKKPFPVWAIVLIIAAVVVMVGGTFAAILIPTFLIQHEKAHDYAVKEGIHSLEVGIRSWAVDHQNVYPSASEMNSAAMSGYIDWWPTNPYTGAPMMEGTGPGDFSYEVSPDGMSFRLVGYGANGRIVMDVGSGGTTI
jgi:hypothetical protein